MIADKMESKNVLDVESSNNNETEAAATIPTPPISFCSLACWSNEDYKGRMVLVYSKQKNVYMTRVQVNTAVGDRQKNKGNNNIDSKCIPNPLNSTNSTVISLLGMTDAVSALVVSNDGRHVVAGSHEGEIVWWDLTQCLSALDKNSSNHSSSSKKNVLKIKPARKICNVDIESNSTVQYLHISNNSKSVVCVTWDEVFVYRFSGGRTIGKRTIQEYFISHARILNTGAVLLIGDDRPRLWTLIPEDEILEEPETKQAAVERLKRLAKNDVMHLKVYDSFAPAFAPKISDECSTLAVNEPSQNMFAIGFCDGGICAWRRSSSQVLATTILPGGLPIRALTWLNQVNEVIACCGTMAYRVRFGRPKCEIMMKIPMKSWVPPATPMFLALHPNYVVLHTTTTTESATAQTSPSKTKTNIDISTETKIITTNKKLEEKFFIDRGDRVDASHCIKDTKKHDPVVVLGTKEGRVHIIRRGGRLRTTTAILPKEETQVIVEKKKEIIDLSLTGLNRTYHHSSSFSSEGAKNIDEDHKEHSKANSKYSLSITVGNDVVNNHTVVTNANDVGGGAVAQTQRFLNKKFKEFQVSANYWMIGKLRQHGLTVWPYDHGYPGVSKGLRPNRYRRLQKMMKKRNLLCLKISLLIMASLLLFVLFLLGLVLYVYLLPPIRVLSKIQVIPFVNKSNGTRAVAVSTKKDNCVNQATIQNETLLWILGNSSSLCDCSGKDSCFLYVGLMSYVSCMCLEVFLV